MNVNVYNQEGKETGTMELPPFFGERWNADLVHQVVVSQQANRRQSVAHAKGRGEVSGGGRKPWRQKGTGRARHGSIRSPIWKGGGVTHGPTKEKVFKKKINRKMAARALATVLAAKVRDHEVLVLEDFALSSPKTKEAVRMFRSISQIKDFSDIVAKPKRSLVLLPDAASELKRALRNLPALELAEARNVTALDVMNRKYVILPKASLTVLTKRLGA
ncbi:MAG: 50S ribosomal protein L4 [Candidatus Sungbacteria bacterium]|uniref:Large ribosomal subunit protein uL4 n=1 Tax=Candidatus Sungiibacteriota bacterium TaxID=2750080 RepID=A0A932YVC6_9BACT|nr:50S ribosomal protein L4 [Candidatus Sungbacteria bacterium]